MEGYLGAAGVSCRWGQLEATVARLDSSVPKWLPWPARPNTQGLAAVLSSTSAILAKHPATARRHSLRQCLILHAPGAGGNVQGQTPQG